MNRLTTLNTAQWKSLALLFSIWLLVVGLRVSTGEAMNASWYFGMALCALLTGYIGWKVRGFTEHNERVALTRSNHERV